jgi:DNA-binding SARP family transcriptional activator
MLALPKVRFLVVVAAAGYGKTTALRTRLSGTTAHWRSGPDAAGLGTDLPAAGADPARTAWVVFDDVPRQAADRVAAIAADLPDHLGLAVASRWPLDLPRPAAHLRPADLALTAADTAALLRDDYGLADPALAERVRALTAGWPALVRLVAAAVARDGLPAGDPVPALIAPEGPLARYIADEVLGRLPAEARRLVRDAAQFRPLTAGLCRALGHRRGSELTALLTRTGVIDARRRIVPLVAAVARQGVRRDAVRRRARTAAGWYRDHGMPVAAARALALTGDDAGTVRLLAERGGELAATAPAVILTLIDRLPAPLRCDRISLLRADALRCVGEVPAALAAFRALGEAAGDRWDPGLAWRYGLAHYLRGEPRAALACFARAVPGAGAAMDRALLAAWTASAHAMLGEAAAGLEQARRAVRETEAAGGVAAAASAAHLALAQCLRITGDAAGRERHVALALRHAEQARDPVQITRVLVNRAHDLLLAARYPQALEVARRAGRLAGRQGPAGLLLHALSYEGDALTRLGRYDEAVRCHERALRLGQKLDSRRVSAPLIGLGEAYRRRGRDQQATGAFEEALRSAGDTGPARVLALAGLARVGAAPDRTAADLADCARDWTAGVALVTRGRLALAAGDRSGAADLAERAARAARDRRESAVLAEALEVWAVATGGDDPAAARAALAEAVAIWRDGGATADADRLLVLIGRLAGTGAADRLAALLAADRLAGTGAAEPDGVHVRTLGRFDVLVDGRATAASAWQSRKARDVLKILVARRGRPVPRDELAELLWPADDPGRTGHRLSVQLSIVRGVLDPARTRDPDHFLVADQASVALDRGRLRVDVEDFLGAVAHGLGLRGRGAVDEARVALGAAERLYGGDLFEDEPYADWAVPLREEARAAYLRCVRVLADLGRAAGDTEQAVWYLLRLLDKDPYDEAAHRAMVDTLAAAGRHGEARRASVRYRAAMRAIA